MAIGATITAWFRSLARQPFQATPVIPMSVQSDWLACTNTNAANSAAELLNPASADDATTFPVEVPPNATRFLWRIRFPIATTTLTTDPIVRFYATDSNGIAMRIDNASTIAAGLEIDTAGMTVATDFLKDSTYYYTKVYDLDGIDLKGLKTLYPLTATASNYNAGGAALAAEIQVLFLN